MYLYAIIWIFLCITGFYHFEEIFDPRLSQTFQAVKIDAAWLMSFQITSQFKDEQPQRD